VLKSNYFTANSMKMNLGNMNFWGFYHKQAKNSKLLNQYIKTIFLIIFLMNLL
jgi:hypothetical protein